LKLREHACLYCPGVAYQKKQHLKTHIETVHEKRRDHACPHCPSAFGEKGHLTRHIKVVHEKRRDHACPYCEGVAFGTAGTLKQQISAIHLKIKSSRGAK
jgi:hypothetical protein